MNDYQRVRAYYPPGTPTPQYTPDRDHGPLKVVPADAIVIERGEVPAVEDVAFMRRLEAGGTFADYDSAPGYYRRTGAAYLALAEYLAAHPPVDEAQVSAMRDDLIRIGVGYPSDHSPGDVARELIEQGWTKPEPTS